MPPTKVTVYDHLGHPWTVASKDPASQLVNELKSLGYAQIMLPVSVLAGWADPYDPAAWPEQEHLGQRYEGRYYELRQLICEN